MLARWRSISSSAIGIVAKVTGCAPNSMNAKHGANTAATSAANDEMRKNTAMTSHVASVPAPSQRL